MTVCFVDLLHLEGKEKGKAGLAARTLCVQLLHLQDNCCQCDGNGLCESCRRLVARQGRRQRRRRRRRRVLHAWSGQPLRLPCRDCRPLAAERTAPCPAPVRRTQGVRQRRQPPCPQRLLRLPAQLPHAAGDAARLQQVHLRRRPLGPARRAGSRLLGRRLLLCRPLRPRRPLAAARPAPGKGERSPVVADSGLDLGDGRLRWHTEHRGKPSRRQLCRNHPAHGPSCTHQRRVLPSAGQVRRLGVCGPLLASLGRGDSPGALLPGGPHRLGQHRLDPPGWISPRLRGKRLRREALGPPLGQVRHGPTRGRPHQIRARPRLEKQRLPLGVGRSRRPVASLGRPHGQEGGLRPRP